MTSIIGQKLVYYNTYGKLQTLMSGGNSMVVVTAG